MIADVSLITLKGMILKAGSIFRWEGPETIELYYWNKGPVIFRVIIKRDKKDKYMLFLRQIPPSILLINQLKENAELLNEVKDLKNLVVGLERRRIIN